MLGFAANQPIILIVLENFLQKKYLALYYKCLLSGQKRSLVNYYIKYGSQKLEEPKNNIK